ncbi:hypothetical protein ACMSDN_20640, partial [Bacteroides thetaiotaomicron]|uniref:hypothetical protein n=1 Tax=Bacteroides thetaiotaomicron TaxID=818 RepID=UPI0039C49744
MDIIPVQTLLFPLPMVYSFSKATKIHPETKIREVVSKRWHNLFFMHKVFVSLGIKFFVMAKLHFRPYIPNQTVL